MPPTKLPTAEEVAAGNPNFSVERLESLRAAERMAERLGIEKATYRVRAALGELVAIDGQRIISTAASKLTDKL